MGIGIALNLTGTFILMISISLISKREKFSSLLFWLGMVVGVIGTIINIIELIKLS